MLRLNGQCRSSDISSRCTAMGISTTAASSSVGWSTLRTRYVTPLWMERSRMYQRWITGIAEQVWEGAHTSISRAVDRFKQFADRSRREAPVWAGDRVWLSTWDLKLPSHKLSPKYLGPYKVEKQVNSVSFKLQLPTNMRAHPVFHVSLL